MSATVRPRPAGPGPSRTAAYRLPAAAAAATLGVVVFDPAHRHVPLCPFHAATGLLCPLCGGLRAVNALAHAAPGAALRDNLLVVLALPVLVWWWADRGLRARAGRPPRRWSRPATVTLLLVAALFTVVRNLPFAGALRP